MGRRYQLRHPWKGLNDGQFWEKQDWECESQWNYPPHSCSDRPKPPLGKVQIGDAILSNYIAGEADEEREERFAAAARAMLRSPKWRAGGAATFGQRSITNFEMLLTRREVEMGFSVMKHVAAGAYLKASDFDKPRLLTIRDVSIELVGPEKEEKVCLHFNECEQMLVLNKINGETITAIAGNDDSDQWVGVQVVLYKDKTDMQGRRVDCIRCREPKQTKAAAKAAATQQQIQSEEEVDDIPF